jgi:hypothetical protein
LAARALSCFCASLVLASAGCAFVPRQNVRLDEARATLTQVQADASVESLAPRELGSARLALAEAEHARDTLDDPAFVDHLAYVARQRAAIAREVALQRGAAR